jgi:hypothetical protein
MWASSTVSHEQADLVVTYPLGVLDAATLDVQDIHGWDRD